MGQSIESHHVSRRTILSASPELQLLLRMVAAIGADNAHAAEALVATNFSFESAVHLLATWDCEDEETCGYSVPMRRAEEIDPAEPRCPRCWQGMVQGEMTSFALRQRVHRLQEKFREVTGQGFEIQKRRRATMHFGADDSGVYRMAAASVSEGGDEA